MKKDVNRVLLYLLLIPMLLFAWFAGYYHTTLGNITIECKNPDTVILASPNNTFEKEKEILEQGYFEMRQEKEKTETECSSSKSQASDLSAKFDLLQNQFKQVQESLINSNEQISSLIYKNNKLCDKIKGYGGEC